jgi:hypothetical protein
MLLCQPTCEKRVHQTSATIRGQLDVEYMSVAYVE